MPANKATKLPKLNPPTRPLSCHKCGNAAVTVESDTDRAKRGARTRITATARCLNLDCRHIWPSVHPAAVKQARAQRRALQALPGAA